MTAKANGADPIDAAVAKVDEPQPRTTVNVTLGSTGNVIVIDFPNDVSENELLEFTGWIGTVLMNSVRARPKNRLVVASSIPGH